MSPPPAPDAGLDRVLVVEDDPASAELARRALARAGYAIRLAGGVRDGLAALSRERFVAVLLDYGLPDGDPWAVLAAARKLLPQTPVIVVTAERDVQVAAEVIRRGGADYVSKSGDYGHQLPEAVRRVTALAEAAHARSLLAAIIESSEDCILSVNLDGILTSWNQGAETMYGYRPEEVLGRHVSLLVPEESRSEMLTILGQMEMGRRTSQFETVRRRKDGGLIDVSLSVSPLFDQRGKVVGASAIARDVSERRRLEEHRRRAAELELQNRRVVEESRMKSQHLANMAHELRTPLNAIIGFAEMLHDGKAGPVEGRQLRYLGYIVQSSHHLLELIGSVLDLTKADAGRMELRPEAFDAGELVHEVAGILRLEAIERGIAVAVDLQPPVLPVMTDRGRLRQVLYNYLSNALKFTLPGGQVTVRLAAEGEGQFRIEVEDTGIGIQPEDLGRLFQEFTQLAAGACSRFQGTGLGLALTRRIVEAQGGSVGVRSAPGVGSVFFAVLPVAPAASAS